jgi:hypothetical protein
MVRVRWFATYAIYEGALRHTIVREYWAGGTHLILGGESVRAEMPPGYFFLRITPTPIPLRKRSGYFSCDFSACFFVLNGLDNGVNSRPTYSKSNHCSTILDISDL